MEVNQRKYVKKRQDIRKNILRRSVFFGGLKSLVFLALFLFVVFEYAETMLKTFSIGATTLTMTTSLIKDLKFPPFTICLENGYKPTVMQKYGFENRYAFWDIKDKNITSVWDTYLDSTYLLHKDFEIFMLETAEMLKLGENHFENTIFNHGNPIQVKIDQYHTPMSGTCYEIKSNLSLPTSTTASFVFIIKNPTDTRDFPKVGLNHIYKNLKAKVMYNVYCILMI